MKLRLSIHMSLAALAFLALSSGQAPNVANRGLASCVESSTDYFNDPISYALGAQNSSLFGFLQDTSLRQSALQYYMMLDQAEARALSGRQAIMASYGISTPSSALGSIYAAPSVVNFNPAGSIFASGHLWGDMAAMNPKPSMLSPAFIPSPAPSVAKYFDSLDPMAPGLQLLGNPGTGSAFSPETMKVSAPPRAAAANAPTASRPGVFTVNGNPTIRIGM